MYKIVNRTKFTIAMLIIVISILGIIFLSFRLIKKYYPKNELEIKKQEELIQKTNTRIGAQEIAIEFLKKQSYANEYEEVPVSMDTYEQFVNVWFATKDKNKKPNRGLVQVSKETGEATWKELN